MIQAAIAFLNYSNREQLGAELPHAGALDRLFPAMRTRKTRAISPIAQIESSQRLRRLQRATNGGRTMRERGANGARLLHISGFNERPGNKETRALISC